MRPATWYLNVLPRTLRAFFPGLVRPDDDFARSMLGGRELELYLGMDPRDRHHGVAVARSVLARDLAADGVVVRAALLHDVGKSLAPYRAWERIAVHVCAPPATGGAARPLGALGEAARRHREHAVRGAAMIRAAGGDPEVADLVERHHRRDGDPRLALLVAADDAT